MKSFRVLDGGSRHVATAIGPSVVAIRKQMIGGPWDGMHLEPIRPDEDGEKAIGAAVTAARGCLLRAAQISQTATLPLLQLIGDPEPTSFPNYRESMDQVMANLERAIAEVKRAKSFAVVSFVVNGEDDVPHHLQPERCSVRLQREGQPYPRSGCEACSIGMFRGCAIRTAPKSRQGKA